MFRILRPLLLAAVSACLPTVSYSQQHFEARQTQSIAFSPDGARLLALNSPAGLLVVYALHPDASAPVAIAEIPVGKEPVAVRCRTNEEAWVVSELGDCVSIVNLAQRAVVATLACADEPADVVFAAGKAFVSAARSNAVRVFDAVARTSLGSITLQGLVPRALCSSPAGDRLYVAMLHSGNRTAILPASKAPNPPAPSNPALPVAPKTGIIIASSDSRISYTVLDNDVAEIDTASQSVVRYFNNVGTNLHAITCSADGSTLWVANTNALNLTASEPNLRGHFIDNRLAKITLASGLVENFDLNPGVNYALLPNPAALTTALAQPTAVVLNAAGDAGWVAGFGSDRIAKFNPVDASILVRTDLRLPGQETEAMRGPRAMVLHEATHRLYVLNKLADTVSVVDSVSGLVVAEKPVGSVDTMPTGLREGRGYLFDARLSGNGTASCASCHPDADRDGIAWDLGDPGGQLLTVMGENFAATHSTGLVPRVMHPMKGPMVTQTLRGLEGKAPFHWRGDRPTLQSFGVTYRDLMAGEIPAMADLDKLAGYLESLKHHPNPNRRLNGALPTTLNGGNPTTGRTLFSLHNNHCASCHTLPTGTNGIIDNPAEVGSPMPMKTPSLQTTYQRMFFNPRSGQNSLSGFGIGHDGAFSNLPTGHPYQLDDLGAVNISDFAHVAAFILSFDSGTAPAVGQSRTVHVGNLTDANLLGEIGILESQAAVASTVDLVAYTRRRAWKYEPITGLYLADGNNALAVTRATLLEQVNGQETVTFQGHLPGEGARYGADRDLDGTLNQDEAYPTLTISQANNSIRLQWAEQTTDWYLEQAATALGSWEVVFTSQSISGGQITVALALPLSNQRCFFRLRRTWN